MLIGILTAIGTGLLWTVVGGAMSYCARAKIDFKSYYAVNMFLSALFTAAVYIRWNVVSSDLVGNLLPLVFVIGGAGLISAIGIIVMQSAMARGHNGVIWAIGQSALIIPFLAGIVLFGEACGFMRVLGLMLILLGMVLPVWSRRNRESSNSSGNGGSLWLKLALIAFVLFGIGQTFQSIPSYWTGWQDNACLRPTLGCVGSFVGIVGSMIVFRSRLLLSRKMLLLALLMAAQSVLSIRLFYVAMDHLAAHGMGSIGFPMIVGSCIFGFSIYSIFILKEKCNISGWVALTLTVSGIFALSTI
ncbi:MAG: hypothetical protein JXR78_11510 [Victivallales bacterium]|nr:hypothetical protein [Victivallales bacterium]